MTFRVRTVDVAARRVQCAFTTISRSILWVSEHHHHSSLFRRGGGFGCSVDRDRSTITDKSPQGAEIYGGFKQ